MAEPLKNLITRRGVCKRQLTNFATFLNSIEREPNKSKQLISRLDQIKTVFNEFQSIQTSIEITSKEDEEQTVERDDYENKYHDLVATADELLATTRGQQNQSQNLGAHNEVKSLIKLPQIHLPTFSGSYDEFMPFHDIFNSLIHNNSSLSDVQKFHYLTASLKGDAANVLSALEISNANYSTAWALLKERFENKKLIIQNHIKQIFELPSLSKESCRDLRGLLDNFLKHFRALRNTGQPVESWSSLIIYLLTSKLDYSTKKEWEISSKDKQEPTTDDFLKFLQDRCQILEAIHKTSFSNPRTKMPQTTNNTSHKSLNHIATQGSLCIMCKDEHQIYSCPRFLELSTENRANELKKIKACLNCLRIGHFVSECRSNTCRKCKRRHNTLLHNDNQSHQNTHTATNENQITSHISQVETQNQTQTSQENTTITYTSTNQSFILLSTAIINILDIHGVPHKCRALIDSGSMSNFITKPFFQKLQLDSESVNMNVAGISSLLSNISSKTSATISSLVTNFKVQLPFLIIPKLTDDLPQFTFTTSNLNIPTNITLADENFNIAAPVDILLGAGIFLELLCKGQIRLGRSKPILQETQLGWILSGNLGTKSIANHCFLATHIDIQTQLEKFWSIEECPNKRIMSNEDQQCERHFQTNYQRDPINGRFVVKLPIRENINLLGSTRDIAIKRFISNEIKWSKNHELRDQYKNFMQEYLQLGHMTEIKGNDISHLDSSYYLPHHSVQKATSLTTKTRVVFDGSCRSTTGLSLNDVLLIGPNVQEDLFSIVTRSRKHQIIILADIARMFRQVLVHPSQRGLQRIVWRKECNETLSHFELNTITYGTAPASFLATRCLKQLGLDFKSTHPKASKVILRDFYVDNLMTGTHNIESAKNLIRDLQHILNSAGFELRQWMSNQPQILNELTQNRNLEHLIITETSKGNALGITWDANNDKFLYYTNVITSTKTTNLTKREMLSIIAKLFDPLGLVGPVIITAKIFLQQLWKHKINWDDSVPFEINTKFTEFISNLSYLNEIAVPRKILIEEPYLIEIHGFCDASIVGYGACVYLKSENNKGDVWSRLICAKSRVAPIKLTTVPRLELCSAVLLAKLVDQVLTALDLNINKCIYWSDSTIVLAWLRIDPSKLKPFVGHRIAEIQQLSKGTWNHIDSNENPADLISRGISPFELKNSHLWWEGPRLLTQEIRYPISNDHISSQDLLEFEREQKTITLTTQISTGEIFSRYSNLTKLIRIVAYIYRFVNNCKGITPKLINVLTTLELEQSETILLKLAQSQIFTQELKSLRNSQQVHHQSKLSGFNPFIDKHGLIRVGGRLQRSELPYSQIHQIMLPAKHPLTDLIIRNEHHRNLHAGAQTVLASLRQNYWIINGRQSVRKILRGCITCFKAKPSVMSQQMGPLPHDRVTQNRIFSAVGVDFAGPFDIKDGRTRNRKLVKSYICLFICMSTKAVHVELVGDLTALGFLNALKRFISRRGFCTTIFSDNATNFVGANNLLKDLHSNQKLQNYICDNKIDWKFIPARSPHMGGLWEASVKNIKYYIKRLTNQTNLTFEEFYTFIVQVEAILNSRPLTALSSDPNDFEPLTPGHFIIGAPLNSLPQEAVQDKKFNAMSKYLQIQQMLQHFWQRWSKDYINTLQQRTKWKFRKSNDDLLIGSLVILKEDHQPPCKWAMGRIVALHPGSDNIVRAVSIKTRKGETKRAIHKVCLLPN